MELARISSSPEETQVRITCKKCGKLLFKLEKIADCRQDNRFSHQIEIKCYNRICKEINIINI